MSFLGKIKTILRLSLAGIFFFLGLAPTLQADESSSYDAYSRLLQNKKQEESLAEKALSLPAWPLDVIRGGMDQSLYALEQYHVIDKLKWVYERLTDYGLYPKLQNLANFGDFGAGLEVDAVKLLRQKGNLPYLRVKSGVNWSHSNFFRVFSEIGMDKVEEIGPYGSLYFDLENRPEEDFFGFGPDTSLGDSHNFKSEAKLLELRLGYSLTLHTDLKATFGYKTVDIEDGDDGGKAPMDRNVSGAGGGDFLISGMELMHDTRDFPEDPHKGGFERIKVSYHEGVDGYDFGYFKYRGEFARYHELFSERQVIGGRIVAEHNDEVNHQDIPFFDMARLGGYGVSPSPGDTHRGFQRNRFFGESLFLLNLEYRYLVWQYRELSMDAVIFLDEGQVFNELNRIQLRDFRESFGGGFRFKILRRAILSLEAAKSDEGVELYARSHTPF